MIRFSLRWVLMIASFCLSETAWGQNRNGTNGTPNFGNTGASGLNGVGQPGFGGGGSGGGGGFGATGSGGSGGAGFGSQTGFGSGGQAGSGQNQSGSEGNNGILGRNTNQNQLLGRNVQNQNQGGNEVSGRGRAVGGRGSGRNSLANSLSNGGVSASNQRPVIRPRQEVAFDYPQPSNAMLTTRLASRLSKFSTNSVELKSVEIVVQDKGQVVLRGSVRSPAESKMAQILVGFEPGVTSIRNELKYPAAGIDNEGTPLD